MGLFSLLGKAWDGYHSHEEKRYLGIIKRESLSCNDCGKFAVPVYGTKDKYECLSCGRRFANRNHSIATKLKGSSGVFLERYYQELVDKLR